MGGCTGSIPSDGTIRLEGENGEAPPPDLGKASRASQLNFTGGAGKVVNILSIDGGGCKGVFSVEILKEVERQTGKKLHEVFDLIVGTSAGGLSALAIASMGYNGEDCTKLYEKLSKVMFHSSVFDKVVQEVKSGGKNMFDSSKFVQLAKDTYGEKQLNSKDCLTNVAVLSARVDISPPMGYVAKSYETKVNLSNSVTDVPVYLAGRCTAAAPFVFGPQHVQIDCKHTNKKLEASFVDGGIWQNNPVFEAIVEAEALFGAEAKMNILSVGTGKQKPELVSINGNGFFTNIKNTVDALDLQCGGRAAELLTMDNPNRNFLRVNGYLTDSGNSFDGKYIPGWIKDGKKVVAANKGKITGFCDALKARMEMKDM